MSHRHSNVLSLASLSFLLTAVNAANTITLSAAASAPTDASAVLSPSFAGFGIEPSNLFSFTGGSETNALSINLLQNLADYTGVPPHMRIGGNTEDNMIYDDSYSEYSLQYNANADGQGADPSNEYTFGPKYFEVLNRLPTGTPITFGLNLAYDDADYIDNIVAEASAVVKGLTNVDLVSFEIGNEPDLYLQNGFRNGTWTGTVYNEQWLERAEAVYEQVLKPAGLKQDFFEPGCTASTIGTTFEIEQLAADGLTNSTSKGYVAAWNQHDYYYYIGVSTYTLTLDLFTDLSTTVSQFAAWLTQTQQAADTDLPYVLREMGVVGPIGEDGISNTFAASLWTLNFFLYAATINISSVQFHMTDNSNASAWQPIEAYGNAPFVRPLYYAYAAMAQLIGCNNNTRVQSLPLGTAPSGYDDKAGAYSTYQSNGDLAALVLINTKIVNESDIDSADSLTFSITLASSLANEVLYLSYLTADGADVQHNTTWNGISFEKGEGLATAINTDSSLVQTVKVGSDGVAKVVVRDSQAVVANFGTKLGTLSCSGNSTGVSTSTGSAASASASSAASGSVPSATSTKKGAAGRLVSSWGLLIVVGLGLVLSL